MQNHEILRFSLIHPPRSKFTVLVKVPRADLVARFSRGFRHRRRPLLARGQHQAGPIKSAAELIQRARHGQRRGHWPRDRLGLQRAVGGHGLVAVGHGDRPLDFRQGNFGGFSCRPIGTVRQSGRLEAQPPALAHVRHGGFIDQLQRPHRAGGAGRQADQANLALFLRFQRRLVQHGRPERGVVRQLDFQVRGLGAKFEHGLGLVSRNIKADFPHRLHDDRVQLAEDGRVLRGRINRELMLSGVSMTDPQAVYIDRGVRIGRDSVIQPGATITGATVIGERCQIGQGALISSCSIGDDVVVKAGSVLEQADVHEEVAIGPMAHLRPGSVLSAQVKIGNFVETKKVFMGQGSKASHLTYLGDATIGTNVNIGCGTITCNYDGVNKHQTVIGDDVFVGSDVQLVAPVTVGRNSLIAAGTTVTKDIPPDSLALSRVPQVNKEGWKLKKK